MVRAPILLALLSALKCNININKQQHYHVLLSTCLIDIHVVAFKSCFVIHVYNPHTLCDRCICHGPVYWTDRLDGAWCSTLLLPSVTHVYVIVPSTGWIA